MRHVFYRPEQNCSAATGYSPSAGKPAKVMQDWAERFPDMHIHSDWEPLTAAEISRAHDASYVKHILAGQETNGFGNDDIAVANSLPYTTGSFVAAVKHVMQHGGIACSPTSGFHHARYREAGGYCTFNGLILGALAAQDMGAKNVLILDGDAHYGDGTDDIINKLGLKGITNITADKSYSHPAQLFQRFSIEIEKKPDIILFQAGADIHEDDPLGGILSTSGMTMRDTIVFHNGNRLNGIPVVWNLAGGYQRDDKGSIEPVLSLHRRTMELAY